MSERPKLSFSHMGLFVTDLPKMVDFYTRVLGFVVSDRAVRPDGNEVAFITLDPHEHHQIVLATGRPADLSYSVISAIVLPLGEPVGAARHLRRAQTRADRRTRPDLSWQCDFSLLSRSRGQSPRSLHRYKVARPAALRGAGRSDEVRR